MQTVKQVNYFQNRSFRVIFDSMSVNPAPNLNYQYPVGQPNQTAYGQSFSPHSQQPDVQVLVQPGPPYMVQPGVMPPYAAPGTNLYGEVSFFVNNLLGVS